MKKPYLCQPFQWEIVDPLFIGVYRLVNKISFQGETGINRTIDFLLLLHIVEVLP